MKGRGFMQKRSRKGKFLFDTPKFRKLTGHIIKSNVTRKDWDDIKERMRKSNEDMVKKGILKEMPRGFDENSD